MREGRGSRAAHQGVQDLQDGAGGSGQAYIGHSADGREALPRDRRSAPARGTAPTGGSTAWIHGGEAPGMD
eukprot:1223422-Pyramimonas_sp.AAC.1